MRIHGLLGLLACLPALLLASPAFGDAADREARPEWRIEAEAADAFDRNSAGLKAVLVLFTLGLVIHRRIADRTGRSTRQDQRYRAALALQQATGCHHGAEINLKKIIPMGAGLGGGSSDAATTLLALNHLWQIGLDLDALAQLSANLGADVPVFVHGRAAWAQGIGDRLTNIELPEPCYLIIQPDCSISTAEIFCHEELTRHTTPIKIAGFLDQPYQCRNDCLAVVQQLYPQVKAAIHWLNKFAAARLTGTGACIFAEFASEKAATLVLEQLPKHWHGFVARGLNVSPTHSQLPEHK